MGGDGTNATELELTTGPEIGQTLRRGCLVAGCACADGRILSPRRGRFHAYLARARGQTADRVIAPDSEWSLLAWLNEED